MVELRIQPVVGGVAGVARSRELGRHVVRIDGRSEVRLVAGETLGRHGLEPTVGATLVTSIAVDSGVSAGQRETVVVVLDVLVRDLPSAHRVTLFAIGAQLTAVNVGVAILASMTNVGENHFDVTLGARDRGVQATQRILGLIVIELGNRADRPPRACRMAVLTRDSQTAVRTVRASRNLRWRSSRACRKHEHKNEHEFRFYPSAHDLAPWFRSLPTVRKMAEKRLNVGSAIRSPTRLSSFQG